MSGWSQAFVFIFLLFATDMPMVWHVRLRILDLLLHLYMESWSFIIFFRLSVSGWLGFGLGVSVQVVFCFYALFFVYHVYI